MNNEKRSGMILMLIKKIICNATCLAEKTTQLNVFFSAIFNQRSNVVSRVNSKRLKMNAICGNRKFTLVSESHRFLINRIIRSRDIA